MDIRRLVADGEHDHRQQRVRRVLAQVGEDVEAVAVRKLHVVGEDQLIQPLEWIHADRAREPRLKTELLGHFEIVRGNVTVSTK